MRYSYQGNKKPKLSNSRWALIVGFLHQNYPRIISLQREAYLRNGPNAAVYLENIAAGQPGITVQTAHAETAGKILVCYIDLGRANTEMADQELQSIGVVDIILAVSRQVNVLLQGHV
jgi:hypothetical protein